MKFIVANYRLHLPAVTLLNRSNRIILNKQAWLMLLEKFGSNESSYVRFFIDDGPGNENAFYLELCSQKEQGARKLDQSSARTRTCNVGPLFEMFSLGKHEKTKYPLMWDSSLNAARVDLSTPVETMELKNENR